MASQGKTSIFIAHRLASISHVDCIHVIENGKIVESGNHEQLLKENGIYAEMFKAQQR